MLYCLVALLEKAEGETTDRVSNPGPLTYESGALPIALRGPARGMGKLRHLLSSIQRGTGMGKLLHLLLSIQGEGLGRGNG